MKNHLYWKNLRESLEKRLTVMKHFIAKCTDAGKKAAMEKELEKLDTDFQKSQFFEEVAKKVEAMDANKV